MEKTLLDKALDKYREAFGKNYPLSVVDIRSEREIAEHIAECIQQGKEATPPEYKKGVLY